MDVLVWWAVSAPAAVRPGRHPGRPVDRGMACIRAVQAGCVRKHVPGGDAGAHIVLRRSPVASGLILVAEADAVMVTGAASRRLTWQDSVGGSSAARRGLGQGPQADGAQRTAARTRCTADSVVGGLGRCAHVSRRRELGARPSRQSAHPKAAREHRVRCRFTVAEHCLGRLSRTAPRAPPPKTACDVQNSARRSAVVLLAQHPLDRGCELLAVLLAEFARP